MSITVVVNASNDESRTVMIDEVIEGRAVKVRDVFNLPQVREFFDADADEIAANLNGYNDAEITDGIRSMILNAPLEDGAEIAIDLDGESADAGAGEAQAQPNGGAYANGQPGIVQVFTSGGARTTSIPVVNGVTTVRDAVYNDTLRASAGMSDAQLNQHTVQLNGEVVKDLSAVTVKHGDTIALTVRSAFKDGLR